MKKTLIHLIGKLLCFIAGHCPKCRKHCYELDGWGDLCCVGCEYSFSGG